MFTVPAAIRRDGGVVDPPVFTGPVTISDVQVDSPFVHQMSQYFTGGVDSYALTNNGGQAWLGINTSTGELSGTTPSSPVSVSGVIVTATNTGGSTPTDAFGFEVVAASGYGDDYVYTVRIASDNDTHTIPYYFSQVDMTVYWGDGQSDYITNRTDPASTHTYATAGDYQIRWEGTISAIRWGDVSNNVSRAQVIKMQNVGDMGMSTFELMQEEMTNVIDGEHSLGHVGNVHNTSTTAQNMLRDNTQLTTIDLGDFDAGGLTNMQQMFYSCGLLDFSPTQLVNWDTSAVTTMRTMFYNANAANADISQWDISSLTTAQDMFNSSDWSNAEYDKMLLAWSQQPVIQDGVLFHAGTAKYTESAARLVLTDTYNWAITDGGAA